MENRANGASPGSILVESSLKELTAIRAEMVAGTAILQTKLDAIHPNYRQSAQNLLHYLALRRRDLRPLQLRLASLGLSSLGRSESHVLSTVDALLAILNRLADGSWNPPSSEVPVADFTTGQRLLTEHADALLGKAPAGRNVRIMVTMPSEAANDYTLIHSLLQQGMDCMRINCAHDNADAWLRMIEHLRKAEQALGRQCRVVMDLGGPKLRTGPLEPGPAVAKIRPERDSFGRVTSPARVWLTSKAFPQAPPSPASVCIPVIDDWLCRLCEGERVRFTDARDSKRTWKVVEVTDRGAWLEATKTAYIVPGTILRHERDVAKNDHRTTVIGDLPTSENAILLKQGDRVIVNRDLKPGRLASYDSAGHVLTPPSIGCTIPEVFDDVRSGESIWFDDGRIGGVVETVEASRVVVRITHARLRGEKLRGDKGVNLPESKLRLEALTSKDIEDLPFVAHHADVVEFSFVNSAQDVERLQQELVKIGNRQPAIVLKIETRRSFENLPDLLLTAMRMPRCGVMIARGDLAVECGFERLAEVQEEILWICEAAHVPVIWATQVLETLAKEGMPSRAEITDAAMGDRAECVMLNKGEHMVSAVRVLDDILRRMQSHLSKKRAMLRELKLAHRLTKDPSGPVS